jgi:methylthioxylose transferase
MRVTELAWGRAAVGVGVALVAVTAVWGRYLVDRQVDIRLGAPPLYGELEPRLSWMIAVALMTSVLIVYLMPRMSVLPWRTLLLATSGCALLWGATLSTVEGPKGLLGSLESPHDYLAVVPEIESPADFTAGFVGEIDSYPVHVQGHPPALSLGLWGLDRIGLGSTVVVAALFAITGALSLAAALVALKDIADEQAARSAAPFLAVVPAAITVVTSADAFFMGVIAWGTALLVLATGRSDRTGDAYSLVAGLLLGVSIFLTYGAVVAGLTGLVVAVVRRRVRPLVMAVAAIGAIVVAFGAAGFWWWQGLAATVERYGAGVGGTRPAYYFLFANLAVVALMIGPAGLAGLARQRDRRVWLLAGASACGLALANVSGLSRGEVERIWLPFIPFVMLAASSLATARRGWLAAQLGVALTVAIVVRSPW